MKKFLSLVLVFVMAAGMAGIVPPGIAADPTPDTSWYYANPGAYSYTISTAGQLAGLAVLVNGGISFAWRTLTLGTDIDISSYGADYRGGYNDGKGWTPIGTSDNPFRGTFDGNHNAVTGLGIYNPFGDSHTGLFGHVAEGTVKNLRIENAYIIGGVTVGGVAGRVSGIRQQIENTVIVGDSGYIINCSVRGYVNGNMFVGGIAGVVDIGGNVSESRSVGTSSGRYHIGGIAGVVSGGAVENCYSAGEVSGTWYVGGVAASTEPGSLVKNCYSTATIHFGGAFGGHINTGGGGIAGILHGSEIVNCAALNPVIMGFSAANNTHIGRVLGMTVPHSGNVLYGNYALESMEITLDSADITLNKGHDQADGGDISMEQALTSEFWIDTMGWDISIWDIANGRLPTLRAFPKPIAYGDVDGNGVINAADVTMLRRYIAATDKDAFIRDNPSFNKDNADANGDGMINATDVTLLRTYLAATDPSTVRFGP
jgi:hypothetical protein